MAIMEVSLVPLGSGISISQYVAQALKVLQKDKAIKYELTSMGTIIEGNLDRLFELVKEMHQVIFNSGVKRLVTTIKIDDRTDKPMTGSNKVKSVKDKLKSL